MGHGHREEVFLFFLFSNILASACVSHTGTGRAKLVRREPPVSFSPQSKQNDAADRLLPLRNARRTKFNIGTSPVETPWEMQTMRRAMRNQCGTLTGIAHTKQSN